MEKKLQKVSVIIPAKNEGIHVENTVNSLLNWTDKEIEIIVVDDRSEDNCCQFLKDPQYKMIKFFKTDALGAAKARNFGASKATGDIYVFSDAHVFVSKGWLDQILEDFQRPEISAMVPGIADAKNPKNIGYGQTWNQELKITWYLNKPKEIKAIPLAPGGFLAVRKEVFNAVGGFDRGFRIWGKEDEEFSLKLWLFGYQIFVEPSVIVSHVFRKKHPYRVMLEHVNYNYLRMALSHFNQRRIAKVLGGIKEYQHSEEVITEVILSNVWSQRQEYLVRRKFDDDWFMEKFKILF